MDINELASLVRNRLPYKRFLHSLGVVKEARRLAVLWGADEEKAAIAALLHDITKPLSEAEQLQICRDAGIVLNTVERCEPKVLHAITGAIEAKKSYGIKDAEVLSAIRYHTTGKAGMTLLDRVIYLADFIEEGRTFPGVDELRAAIDRDMEEGLLLALDFSIREVLEKGSMLHPDTIEARNDLLLRRKG